MTQTLRENYTLMNDFKESLKPVLLEKLKQTPASSTPYFATIRFQITEFSIHTSVEVFLRFASTLTNRMYPCLLNKKVKYILG